jgi:hypothetical protein
MGRRVAAVAIAVAVVAAGATAVGYAVWRGYHGQASPYTYDLDELRKTDPKLIVCEESAPGRPTGFAQSRAIAIGPDGIVYVSGDGAIRKFDAAGRKVGELPIAGKPGPLAVDRDGTIYVAVAGRVWVCGADGARKAAWPAADANGTITSLAVTDTDVFVALYRPTVVRRYDKAGKLLNALGKRDPARNVPGLQAPSPYLDVAMAGDGLLRVSNPGRHTIDAYTPAGDFEIAWGEYSSAPAGFCGCCNPVHFALLPPSTGAGGPGGFVTCEKGLTRVKLYDAEGKFLGVVAGPESFERHDKLVSMTPTLTGLAALSVAVAADGRIVVLDPICNELRTFVRTAGEARDSKTRGPETTTAPGSAVPGL